MNIQNSLTRMYSEWEQGALKRVSPTMLLDRSVHTGITTEPYDGEVYLTDTRESQKNSAAADISDTVM
jgi:hypothetical protein